MKAFVIDAMNLVWRNHHKLNHLVNTKGVNTGALYGFLQSIMYTQRRYGDYQINILWDSKSQVRYDLYPAYKAKRKEKRDEAEYQAVQDRVKDLQKILTHFDVRQVKAEGYEADDLATLFKDGGEDIILYSGDRDWLQLVNDQKHVRLLRPSRKGDRMYDEKAFVDEFNFPPMNYPVFKCLKGDKTDNIKGIRGFPEKLATEITAKISSIEEFYFNKASIADVPERWKTAILDSKDLLRMNWRLVTLYNTSGEVFTVGKNDPLELRKYYTEFELDKFLSQIKKESFLRMRRDKDVVTQPVKKPLKRFKLKAQVEGKGDPA